MAGLSFEDFAGGGTAPAAPAAPLIPDRWTTFDSRDTALSAAQSFPVDTTNYNLVSDTGGPNNAPRWAWVPKGGFGTATAEAPPTALSFNEFANYEPPATPAAKISGGLANLGAGFNEGLAGNLGAPVDAATWLINKGIGGVNALTDSNIPPITNPVGGSDSIKSALGYLPLGGTDPRNVEPADVGDQLWRAGGNGVASMVLPFAGARAIPAAVSSVPTVGQGVLNALRHGTIMSNAIIGGVAGAGGQVAENLVPQPYKPLANFGGQVAVGGLAGLSVAAARKLLEAAGRLAGHYIPPMLPGKLRPLGPGANGEPLTATKVQQRMAGERLRAAASKPSELAGRLDDGLAAGDLVPGSQPTTFQLTNDLGLGQRERVARTKNEALFAKRRAAQNVARVDALDGLAAEDAQPSAVSELVRRQLRAVDAVGAGRVDAARDQVQTGMEGLGGNLTPQQYGGAMRAGVDQNFRPARTAADASVHDAYERAIASVNAMGGGAAGEESGSVLQRYGGQIRQPLAEANAAAREREGALWRAIDPHGNLAVATTPIRDMAVQIAREMPRLARPMEGEEGAIFDAVRSLPHVENFQEIGALRSRLTEAMRGELSTNGRTPAYRRMTQLLGAVHEALEAGVEKQVEADAKAVAAGQKSPNDTVAARLNPAAKVERIADLAAERDAAARGDHVAGSPAQSFTALEAAARDKGGTAVTAPNTGSAVFTASGRRIDVGHEVVDLAGPNAPIASHTPDLVPNRQYPANLQPRDRTRAMSGAQINDIASRIQPERLGASSSPGEGAPIVGPDNVVESGNARTLALAKAYRENSPQARAYRAWLESQGYDTSRMGAPALVRRRLTELSQEDRVRFTQEANTGSGLAMSTTERAVQDASRLSDQVLSLYRGGAELDSAANADFVRGFVQSVPDKSEMGAFVTPDRMLSVEGKRRIEAALLQRAYGNSGLVRDLMETGDENIRAFGNALVDAAGDFAKLHGEIAAGRVQPEMDISKAVNEAAAIVQNARSKGVSLRDAVAQRDAFRPLSAITDELLRQAYGHDLTGRASRARLAEVLHSYVEEAGRQSTETRLFGEPVSSLDVLTAAGRARNGGRVQTAGTGVGSGADATVGAGGSEARPQARGSGVDAAGQGTPGSSGAGREILPEDSLTHNFDDAARARYAAAREATAERSATFGEGATGRVLQPGKRSGEFKLPDSQVAGQFFNGGKHAAEDVQSFVKAAGGQSEAVDALKDYAAFDLRRSATAKDGTLDVAGYQRWLKSHAEALSAFPELKARFDTAAKASRVLGELREQRQAIEDLYPIKPGWGDAEVAERFFQPGNRGIEDVQTFQTATGGNRNAIDSLKDYAAFSLRKAAERGDGTLDLNAYQRWLNRYSSALSAFPEVKARFENLAEAQRTLESAAAMHKQALEVYQMSAAAKFLDDADPVAAVGKILRSDTRVQTFTELARMTANDPAARAGLQRAVVEHIGQALRTNTEAGETGTTFLKSDGLQTFVRKNAEALAQIFSPDQVRTMQAVAADLQRANRSNTTKAPAGPGTAQDISGVAKHAAESGEGGNNSMLGVVVAMTLEHHTGSILSSLGGILGLKYLNGLRSAGLKSIDDLVTEALLNPELARTLLTKVRPQTAASVGDRLGAQLLTLGGAASVTSQSREPQPAEEKPRREPVQPPRVSKMPAEPGASQSRQPAPGQFPRVSAMPASPPFGFAAVGAGKTR